MPSLQTARRVANAKNNGAKTIGQIYKEQSDFVKDLSRFSRNYIDGGRYLEKIFPQLGIQSRYCLLIWAILGLIFYIMRRKDYIKNNNND